MFISLLFTVRVLPAPRTSFRSALTEIHKSNVCFPVFVAVRFFLARSKAVCELCRNLSAGADSPKAACVNGFLGTNWGFFRCSVNAWRGWHGGGVRCL